MTSDNHISSVLLLILVGLAIYFLLNSNSNYNSDTKIEAFDNQQNNDIIQVPNNATNNNVVDANIANNVNFKEVNNQEVQNNYSNQYTNNGLVQQVQSPQVQHQLAQQLLPNQLLQQQNNNFQIPPSSGDYVPTNDNLNNFQPNDEETFNYAGTSLNDAFASPLPAGADADIVDFKKGNMDNYDAKDFLPKEINDEWFETDFSLAKYQLNDDKLINTERYIIGINTVGQSLKNASYDIRGTVPCPKFVISPFNQSTYEPDFNLKPLC
jgi:hypothetical protein